MLEKLVGGLAVLSLAWSVAIGVWIATTPIWREGIAAAAVLVPVGLGVWAARAAWHRRSGPIWASAGLLAAFCFVTGFSIGNAYVPAAVVLASAAMLSMCQGGR